MVPLVNSKISQLLLDDYKMLVNYVEGKTVQKILACTENQVALLMEDGNVIRFLQIEDELIFDIEPCRP